MRERERARESKGERERGRERERERGGGSDTRRARSGVGGINKRAKRKTENKRGCRQRKLDILSSSLMMLCQYLPMAMTNTLNSRTKTMAQP